MTVHAAGIAELPFRADVCSITFMTVCLLLKGCCAELRDRWRVSQFEWRNGWFYGLSKAALEAGRADPCPKHTALLKELGTVA